MGKGKKGTCGSGKCQHNGAMTEMESMEGELPRLLWGCSERLMRPFKNHAFPTCHSCEEELGKFSQPFLLCGWYGRAL